MKVVCLVVAKVVDMEVEMVDKGSKRRSSLSWWLLCWRLQEARKKKRSKMKGERRRGGIYRSWIVK